MNLDHDLHIHTYLSACCHDKAHHRPHAILDLAAQMGVKTIGFADHLWVNPDLAPSDWYRPQDARQTARLRADLAACATDVRVLVGCEAEMIAPGKIGLTADYARQLDFVLLACNHFHMREFVEQPASGAAGRRRPAFLVPGSSRRPSRAAWPPRSPTPSSRAATSRNTTRSSRPSRMPKFRDAFGLAAERVWALR